MSQEDKQLLLKDLCARLPYGVKVKYLYWDEDKGCEYPIPMILDDINSDGYIRFHGDIAEGEGRGYILTYLPYLRPMSSMTEEDMDKLNQYVGGDRFIFKEGIISVDENFHHEGCLYSDHEDYANIIDWLNAHHFDYRGLIEKGLALEAPEGMYK